jgi:hypothetical protein
MNTAAGAALALSKRDALLRLARAESAHAEDMRRLQSQIAKLKVQLDLTPVVERVLEREVLPAALHQFTSSNSAHFASTPDDSSVSVAAKHLAVAACRRGIMLGRSAAKADERSERKRQKIQAQTLKAAASAAAEARLEGLRALQAAKEESDRFLAAARQSHDAGTAELESEIRRLESLVAAKDTQLLEAATTSASLRRELDASIARCASLDAQLAAAADVVAHVADLPPPQPLSLKVSASPVNSTVDGNAALLTDAKAQIKVLQDQLATSQRSLSSANASLAANDARSGIGSDVGSPHSPGRIGHPRGPPSGYAQSTVLSAAGSRSRTDGARALSIVLQQAFNVAHGISSSVPPGSLAASGVDELVSGPDSAGAVRLATALERVVMASSDLTRAVAGTDAEDTETPLSPAITDLVAAVGVVVSAAGLLEKLAADMASDHAAALDNIAALVASFSVTSDRARDVAGQLLSASVQNVSLAVAASAPASLPTECDGQLEYSPAAPLLILQDLCRQQASTAVEIAQLATDSGQLASLSAAAASETKARVATLSDTVAGLRTAASSAIAASSALRLVEDAAIAYRASSSTHAMQQLSDQVAGAVRLGHLLVQASVHSACMMGADMRSRASEADRMRRQVATGEAASKSAIQRELERCKRAKAASEKRVTALQRALHEARAESASRGAQLAGMRDSSPSLSPTLEGGFRLRARPDAESIDTV